MTLTIDIVENIGSEYLLYAFGDKKIIIKTNKKPASNKIDVLLEADKIHVKNDSGQGRWFF